MNKIITLPLLAGVFTAFTFSSAPATNWLVGPTRTYTKPSQVANLVQNGDTVSIDPATYTADVCKWNANNLLLRGVGGMPHLDANNTAYGQKGIWVIAGNNTRVESIEFTNCHDVAGVDMNWAGIRQEGLNLTVSRCKFRDNDNGILAGTFNPSKMIIEYTEFNHNGYGDGYSHNLYINHLDTLIFRYNYSHHAHIGHELKSRAHVNYILFNRFSNESGDASREIDLPDGGLAIIMGNVVEQGPGSTNSGIIGYGLESFSNNAPHQLYLVNNTIINNRATGTFVSVGSSTALYKAYNNIMAGPGTFFNGTPTQLDTMNNWKVSSVATCGFINAAGYDFRLTAGSGAVNTGTNAGNTLGGYSLTPALEYLHPNGQIARPNAGVIDRGAHELPSSTSISYIIENQYIKYNNIGNKFKYDLKAEKDGRVRWLDLSGREVFVAELLPGSYEISLQQVPAGLYLFEIRLGAERVAGKFLVTGF